MSEAGSKKPDESHSVESTSNEQEMNKESEQKLPLPEQIKHNLTHNAEVEACDLLIEEGKLEMLLDMAEKLEHMDYDRICLYLMSCVPFMPDPDNISVVNIARQLYMHFENPIEAMRCAMKINDVDAIDEIFNMQTDGALKMQMAIMLGRQQIFLDIDNETLSQLNSNTHLHKHFIGFARELDLMAPKSPDDVYKTHLEPSRPFSTQQPKDTPTQNLASSFVNGFVNSGFGTDAFFKDDKSASDWLNKHKEWAAFSTAASFGVIHHWDVDSLNHFENHTHSNDVYIKSGALLASGLVFAGVQDPDVDAASALLRDFLFSEQVPLRVASVLGLGLAYANSKREAVLGSGEDDEEEKPIVYELRKVILDEKPGATTEVKCLAALSLGFILIGTGRQNTEVVQELVAFLLSGVDLKDPNMRFVALSIGLIYLGKQDECDETIFETLRALPGSFSRLALTLVDICAYAGTGNVLKVQEMLHICSEERQKSENGESTAMQSLHEAVAVLGIALVAMGEEVGAQMCLRMFGHVFRYGETVARRAVPLALALLSPSNPQLTIIETLSKYSHDSDPETARNAVFSLGIVGAGTNNARVLAMLRQLASYHSRDQKTMMLVRLAQGMIHLGKGTQTLDPFHSHRQLFCPVAVAALLSTCLAFVDGEQMILNGKQHYLIYTLVGAIQPRMLITVMQDTNDPNQLVQKQVQVRVGQAVDVVAQAGKPRTITGFQTHTTPVLLAYGERAELAEEEYTPYSSVLEGVVILKTAADGEEEEEEMEH